MQIPWLIFISPWHWMLSNDKRGKKKTKFVDVFFLSSTPQIFILKKNLFFTFRAKVVKHLNNLTDFYLPIMIWLIYSQAMCRNIRRCSARGWNCLLKRWQKRTNNLFIFQFWQWNSFVNWKKNTVLNPIDTDKKTISSICLDTGAVNTIRSEINLWFFQYYYNLFYAMEPELQKNEPRKQKLIKGTKTMP